MLQNRRILLAVSGGIAAYKCAELVRLFVKEGAQVKVLMTPAAEKFVTKETLSVLSKNEVVSDFFSEKAEWNNHVHMAEWADIMVIAPLTANTLAKMAQGICDNIVLACYFSARKKVIVAPAMDLDMYKHATVIKNLETIKTFGNRVIAAQSGELASGLVGEGRMAEPADIVEQVKNFLSEGLPLAGLRAMVTAGPTYEAIDPVRFIGNRSSGKMGVAIAEELALRGAQVHLILGPSSISVPSYITVSRVESSDEMYAIALESYTNADIAVCSAAVADYKPKEQATEKIKKKDQGLEIALEPTKDILAALGALKTKQTLVGFALETNNLIEYASGKLTRKNLDLIVANEAGAAGGVFGSDYNKITLINKHNKSTTFELKSKQEAAKDIVDAIISLRAE